MHGLSNNSNSNPVTNHTGYWSANYLHNNTEEFMTWLSMFYSNYLYQSSRSNTSNNNVYNISIVNASVNHKYYACLPPHVFKPSDTTQKWIIPHNTPTLTPTPIAIPQQRFSTSTPLGYIYINNRNYKAVNDRLVIVHIDDAVNETIDSMGNIHNSVNVADNATLPIEYKASAGNYPFALPSTLPNGSYAYVIESTGLIDYFTLN
jgi:hypothetical protein